MKNLVGSLSRIVVISPSDFPGVAGDSANYSELIEGFARKGLKVLLICPRSREGKFFDTQMSKKGIEVIRIPFCPPRLKEMLKGGARRSFVLRLLVFYIVEVAVVLHAFMKLRQRRCMIRHSILTLPLAPFLKALRIHSLADGDVLFGSQDQILPVPRYMLKILYRLENLHLYNLFKISTTAQEKTLLAVGYPKKRIILAGIGIDLCKIPYFDPEAIPPYTYGYFGAIEKWQGVDLLVKSFAKVVQREIASKLFIIGDGSLKEKLREESRNIGISENIAFIDGTARETLWHKYFKLFRIAVFPRPILAQERPSIKLAEALASGKPVITTSVEGMKEMAHRGVLFVPPGSEDALGSAMLLLGGNDIIVAQMSREALTSAQQFDINHIIDKLLTSICQYW